MLETSAVIVTISPGSGEGRLKLRPMIERFGLRSNIPVVNSLSPSSVSMRGVTTKDSSTTSGIIIHLKLTSSEPPAGITSIVSVSLAKLSSRYLTWTSSAEAVPPFVTVAVTVIAVPTLLRRNAILSNPTTSEI